MSCLSSFPIPNATQLTPDSIGSNDPEEGKRQFLKGSLVELDNEASPAGWHAIPSSKGGVDVKKFTDTRGNNVFAQDNPDGGNEYENNYRPSGGKNLSFDFPLGWPKEGKPRDPTSTFLGFRFKARGSFTHFFSFNIQLISMLLLPNYSTLTTRSTICSTDVSCPRYALLSKDVANCL